MLDLKNKHIVEINYWDLNSQEGYLIITNTPKVKEAEKILDELREKVDNSKYHFGIKTYKDFTGEVDEDVLHNDFVVYAKPLTNEEYLEKYQKAYGNLTEEEKTEVLKYYHNPMSDEEYLEKYQKALEFYRKSRKQKY